MTYREQIAAARDYRRQHGRAALLNPAGYTGKACGCCACYCCAAWSVARIDPVSFAWSLIGPPPALAFPAYKPDDYARHAAQLATDARPA